METNPKQSKKKRRKYPPSTMRYLERNPKISMNLSKEIVTKFEEICKKKSLTKAAYVKQFIFDTTHSFDDIKQVNAAELNNLKQKHTEEIDNLRKVYMVEIKTLRIKISLQREIIEANDHQLHNKLNLQTIIMDFCRKNGIFIHNTAAWSIADLSNSSARTAFSILLKIFDITKGATVIDNKTFDYYQLHNPEPTHF